MINIPNTPEDYKVLIVDDDEAFLHLFKKKLPRWLACSLTTAKSYIAGKLAIEQGKYDLVLFDYSLDNCTTGLELFSETIQFLSDSCNILISTQDEIDLEKKACSAGFHRSISRTEKFFSDLKNVLPELGFKIKAANENLNLRS